MRRLALIAGLIAAALLLQGQAIQTGGGSGGGGAITAAANSYANGAYPALETLIGSTNTKLDTLNTTAGGPLVGVSGAPQSSSNPAGWFNINQTTPGTTNGVSLQAYPGGGWSGKWFIAAASDNATNLKASSGVVHGIQVYGIGSSPAWLKFYDKATTPTCGTDTVVAQYLIPAASTAANGAGNNAIVIDRQFSTGISYCVVTGITASDDTAPSANLFVVNIGYK